MTVFQPLLLLDGELVLRPVTFIPHMGMYEPGVELALTCDPSRVRTQSGFENRNVANLMGFRTRVDCNPLRSGDCQYGDTLRVILEVPSTAPDSLLSSIGLPPDTAIVATLECMVANVRRSRSLHFLTVRVAGGFALARFGRTWDVTRAGGDPTKREFLW